MISGLHASDPMFLADLDNAEARISRANQQISSGIRVSQASDDPAAVAPILEYQDELTQLTQTTSNLNQQKTIASTADGALQSASTLLNQLISIGTQAATVTATADSRQALAMQVQQIQTQLVGLANTTVQGRYIFGGDAPQTQPYSFDLNTPPWATSNGAAGSTATISNGDSGAIGAGLTATQIFDAPSASVFQAAYALATALTANDQTAIQNATTQVQAAAQHVTGSAQTYGNIETWIEQALTNVSARSTDLTSAISGLRDTDIAAAATDLSQGNVALEAALSARASMTTKSLFSYLG
jgi:flagellar hook-associated protein 3 FlgL